jgi:hypothetical protein
MAAPSGPAVRSDSLVERRGFEPTVRFQLYYVHEEPEIPPILGSAFR